MAMLCPANSSSVAGVSEDLDSSAIRLCAQAAASIEHKDLSPQLTADPRSPPWSAFSVACLVISCKQHLSLQNVALRR